MRLELEKKAKQSNVELKTYKPADGINKIPKDIEGFIAVGIFSDLELEYLQSITSNGVFIDTTPDPKHYDSVRPDMKQITNNAIDIFVEKGHDRIGFIGGTYHNPNTDADEMDLREKFFRRYLTEKSLLNDAYIYTHHGFSVDNGYHLMSQAINDLGEQLPTAFFVAADPIAAFNILNGI